MHGWEWNVLKQRKGTHCQVGIMCPRGAQLPHVQEAYLEEEFECCLELPQQSNVGHR